ncbi:MAG: hypothetical protein ILO42_07140 [Clostridia bacterium]|nr:hypothetical protein [Clostridia bacterium]MBP5270715.1 hypothetical protein [Clostridia bacterium]
MIIKDKNPIRTLPAEIDEEEGRRIVTAADERFAGTLCRLADDIIAKGEKEGAIRAISLCGPTCSGKTTAASMIIRQLENRGCRVHVISLDDYYFNRAYLLARSETGKIDFDSPGTIDTDLLSMTVNDLLVNGKRETYLPEFDFNTGNRSGFRRVEVDPGDVFLFEGIQALYPEVASLFKNMPHASIFITVMRSIRIGDRIFNRDYIRLIRRLVRDFSRRGASADTTFKLWPSVRENENVNIYPYSGWTDYHVDSMMDFDIPMLKPYLLKVFEAMDPDSPYAFDARAIADAVAGVPVIDRKWLAPDSIYREFI